MFVPIRQWRLLFILWQRRLLVCRLVLRQRGLLVLWQRRLLIRQRRLFFWQRWSSRLCSSYFRVVLVLKSALFPSLLLREHRVCSVAGAYLLDLCC